MDNRLTRRTVLEMLKNHQISSQEAFALLDRDPQSSPGTAEPTRDISKEVVIIGMSCRFPGARDTQEFWNNLAAGKNCITEIPKERWDIEELDQSDPQSKYRWGGFMSEIDQFDPFFFNISPSEAEVMDPQQRLFLQETWKALEDAGYSEQEITGKKCGVFVGCGGSDYAIKLREEMAPPPAYSFMGNAASILPARISYYLNLKGPAITVDTACSSSLAAMTLAYESICSGTCDLAIAGGAMVTVTPAFYILSGLAGMLSPEGKCKTFDDTADGFVPGEGIGVVILKPLLEALKHGNQVYAIIRGLEMNQDGKTNGITAPSAISQTALQCRVYDKFNIHPETITYVETHGTGTKLGDPIEIHALTDAFGKYTDKKQFCALGSVKTNIGHALTAAAIAGVIKVLLAIKHKQIPPSLHFKTPNRHINFKETPFYVNTQLSDWQTGDNKPRRAAVSSFGFSGTNVHMVLEEFPGQAGDQSAGTRPYYFIPISAKTKSALEQKYRDLFNWLETGANESMADIAFVHHRGRTHFALRTALIVKDAADLKSQLKTLQQKEVPADCCSGNLEETHTKPDPILKELGQRLINEIKPGHSFSPNEYKDKLKTLAQLYIKGCDLEWDVYYQGERHRLIALPTYPFDTERYWIPGPGKTPAGENRIINPQQRLHPLIDRNISDLEKQAYTTRLNGKEFYLAHHVVNEKKMLPGVVYLEMARAAGNLAGKTRVKKIKDIIWAKPIQVSENPCEVNINLYPRTDPGEIDYEVTAAGNGRERSVHARGVLVLDRPAHDANPIQPRYLDIETIKKRCLHRLEGPDCYKLFRELGLKYGPSFQTIQRLYYNRQEALSQLKLPPIQRKNFNAFELHPSLMDGALQTVLGVMEGFEQAARAIYLPFSLGEIEILNPLPRECYVYLTFAHQQPGRGTGLSQFDIQITDEKGGILVKIKDYSLKILNRALQIKAGSPTTGLASPGPGGIIYYQGVWEQEEHPLVSPAKEHDPSRAVLVFDIDHQMRDTLAQQWQQETGTPIPVILVKPGNQYQECGNHVFTIEPGHPPDYGKLLETLCRQHLEPGKILHRWSQEPFPPSGATIESQLTRSIYSLFFLTRELMMQKFTHPVRLVYEYPGFPGELQPHYAAVGAFARTVHQENPQFIYKTLEIPFTRENRPVLPVPTLSALIIKEFQPGPGVDIRYEDGKRYVRKLRELAPPGQAAEKSIPLKDKGVYLITGGLGALGLVFARCLARKVKARLVLTDIAEPGPDQETGIKELQAAGTEVLYVKADVSRPEEVNHLVKKAKARYKQINGIIHTAGLLRDAFILKKTREEIDRVLAPKVYGTIYLDEALKQENLDFFLLFSSITAEIGSTGQCDYAYANRFMDHFAQKREVLRARQERSGKTLSIDWPFWKDGGMNPGEQAVARMEEQIGMIPITTHQGIRVFEDSLCIPVPHLVVFNGQVQKIKNIINTAFEQENLPLHTHSSPARDYPGTNDTSDSNDANLKEKTINYLKNLLAKTAKLPPGKINPSQPLEKYGIDSVMIMDLNRELEKDFGQLSKTLFFEYQRLNELSGYFIKYHREKLNQLLGTGPPPPAVPGPEPSLEPIDMKRNRFWPSDPGPNPGTDQQYEDIAVIGLSGRYPMAKNLEEFWENLKQKKDCITQIPGNRWDHQLYYSPEKNNPWKTYGKWGGFIDDVDKFDPLFFNISPKEAELLDPQERIFLQTVWHTLEDAGCTREMLKNLSVGVIVGVMYGPYQLFGVEDLLQGTGYAGTSSYASIANRVSYYFDLHGPSIALDTMCSSALTAIHLACQLIRSGESHMAIAGGVNLSLHPAKFIQLSQGKFLSSDGRCRSFGQGGDGYVPGEGVGAVLLKPLKKAAADNDHIYGVIKASSVNHGGKTNGYTVPNPAAQARLIKNTIKKAGLEPRSISYIETHGTGTSLGDPIEITGLEQAFAGSNLVRQSCPIGSVKSNIGHLESAAGIAALTKVLLQMKHKQLVPSIHSAQLNPNINFAESHFYVQQELIEWKPRSWQENGKAGEYPRTAGISSFGAGGSNAHLIVAEYIGPQIQPLSHPREPQVIVLSAKNEERLKNYAGEMLQFLKNIETPGPHPLELVHIAYTLQTGREAMKQRMAVIVTSIPQLIEKLSRYTRGKQLNEDIYTGNAADDGKKIGLLLQGRAGEEYLKIIMEEKKLDTLAQAWVWGADINWELLHPPRSRYRVSLPTYPFARERYWLPRPQIPPQTSRSHPVTANPVPNTREKTGQQHPTPQTALQDEKFILQNIQTDLMEFLETLLKVKKKDITPDGVMFEYGFDSISFVQYINQIKDKYSIELEVQAFFDLGDPTIEKLARYLYETFKDRLISHFQERLPGEFPAPPAPAEETGKVAQTREAADRADKKNSISLLQQIEEDILQISSISLTANENGYDEASIQAFIHQVNKKFHLALTPGVFLHHSSIGAFIKYLKRNFKNQFKEYYHQNN